MCGITGILHKDQQMTLDRQVLERMTDKLVHRGPDDCGLWIDGAVGFGHRRPSILDLAGGHQPMAGRDGTSRATYNGAI